MKAAEAVPDVLELAPACLLEVGPAIRLTSRGVVFEQVEHGVARVLCDEEGLLMGALLLSLDVGVRIEVVGAVVDDLIGDPDGPDGSGEGRAEGRFVHEDPPVVGDVWQGVELVMGEDTQWVEEGLLGQVQVGLACGWAIIWGHAEADAGAAAVHRAYATACAADTLVGGAEYA